MKERERKLLIPTRQNHRDYFEGCLRVDGIQCPYGAKRETSGDCPFCFAGGACRECGTSDREKHGIIQAWTQAIADAGSSASSGSPSNRRKAKTLSIPDLLSAFLQSAASRIRKYLEKSFPPPGMKERKPKSCQGYGTRSQGICPFDVAGGTCRACPESVAAFNRPENIASKNSGHGNSANLVPGKIKSAFLFFTDVLKKRAQLLIGWFNNRRHNNPPCFDCIKRGGVCQPQCEKRTRRRV